MRSLYHICPVLCIFRNTIQHLIRFCCILKQYKKSWCLNKQPVFWYILGNKTVTVQKQNCLIKRSVFNRYWRYHVRLCIFYFSTLHLILHLCIVKLTASFQTDFFKFSVLLQHIMACIAHTLTITSRTFYNIHIIVQERVR